MAKLIHELPQTKGAFQVRGVVSEMQKETAYQETQTKNGNTMRRLKFAVSPDDKGKIFLELTAFPKTDVYFYSKNDKKTIKVPFANRHKPQAEGYNLIGINLGLEKVVDKKGKEINKKITLCEYDATMYIFEHLSDGDEVFINGDIEFSSQNTDDGFKRYHKLVPKQIYLLSQPLDFTAEDFVPHAYFSQQIIKKDVIKNEEKAGEFILQANTVNYSSIEDIEFTIKNSKLAQTLKKNVKPYTSLVVTGTLHQEPITEQVEVEDDWGETDHMSRINSFSPMQFLVTGAKKETLDTDTYTKESIITAQRAIEEWGANKIQEQTSKTNTTATDDDDDWGAEIDDEEIPF